MAWSRAQTRVSPVRLLAIATPLLALLSLACDKPHVLVVGLDGANWRAVEPLIDAGLLPNIGRLVRSGARADLDCYPADPPSACFCPPVWTSLATGTDFQAHRIRGFYARSELRRSPAIWNLAAENGARVVTASWRGTWPPEPGIDYVLTEPGLDQAAEAIYEVWTPQEHPGRDEPDPLFHPPDLMERLGMLPAQGARPPLWSNLARDRVAMEALLRLEDQRPHEEPWDRRTELTMILIHAPDKVAHLLWGAYQQVMYGPFDADAYVASARNWRGPVTGAGPFGWGPMGGPYQEADAWLGRLLALHPYDYVVFLSDHGMTRNPAPDGLAGHHDTISLEAHTGIFAVSGPGVRRGAWLGEISVLDVAPTLAYLLNLPIDEELPGRVVEEAFTPTWLEWKPASAPSARTTP